MKAAPISLTLCLLVCFIVLLVLTVQKTRGSIRESFESPIQTIHPKNIYDDFYAPVYESLITDQVVERTKFEVDDLIRQTQIDTYQTVDFLDIGCGGGGHCQWLSEKKYEHVQLTGLDLSDDMLKISRNKHPSRGTPVRFVKGDFNDPDLFMRGSFSHITCYYFTVYNFDMKQLAEQVHYYLQPRGWFVVHVVDMERFDPILDVANPFVGVTPQSRAKKRITQSDVDFKTFKYVGNFSLKGTDGYFEEAFYFKDKPVVRKQKHKLRMFEVNSFIDIFGEYQMTLKHTTDLRQQDYAFQYLLYFQKN